MERDILGVLFDHDHSITMEDDLNNDLIFGGRLHKTMEIIWQVTTKLATEDRHGGRFLASMTMIVLRSSSTRRSAYRGSHPLAG